MTSRRPAACVLAASLALVAACTSRAHPGSGSSSPRTSATRSLPFVSTPVALSGASPFGSCPHRSGVVPDSEVEPSLAADPRDPRRLLAAWQQDRNSRGGALGIVTASSADGGATWRQALPPHLTKCTGGRYALASDPVVSVGPDRAYLSAIAIAVTGSGQSLEAETDVVVSASADGGETWGDPVLVAASANPLVSLDKETILADPRAPGTAYAVWVKYTNPSAQKEARTNDTYFARTTDGGRTWSAPQLAYRADTETQFHQLVELQNGELLDVFVEAPSLSERPPFPAHLAVIRSTDGGLTWSSSVTAATISFTAVVDPTGKDHVRGTGQGILAAAGPGGIVYVCWSEPRRSADSLLAVVRSDDGGRTWTPPMTVLKERAQPFIPSVAVAGNGSVGVSWYEVPAARARTNGTELSTVVRFAWSSDRGATWRFLRLAGPFDLHTAVVTTGGDFVGDYEGLVGLPAGFAALDALAKPQSRSGPTEVFLFEVEPGA